MVFSRIKRIFGRQRAFNLKAVYSGLLPNPLSVKTTPTIERIDPNLLEQVYIESPLVFNAINKTVQIIMSTEYHLEGDEKTVSFFEDFLASIGYRGGEWDWESLLDAIFKYQCIYGCAPVELIYAKKSNEIVDLDIIDPKKFDYARDASFRIALDEFGNPLGYVQTLPAAAAVENKIKPPPGVQLMSNQIFFPPERIAHFKLYTVGDGFYGIGLIEPIYKTFIRLKASEEGFANASYRCGFPLVIAKIGDENHDPTPEHIKNALEDLKDINSRYAFAAPYYNDLKILEPKHPEKIRTYLDYYIEQIVTGMGLPKAFATGAGETTNRATLARQEYITKLTLKDIIKKTTKIIESKIFYRVAELHNKAHPNDRIGVPKMVWGEIALEELDSKCQRIVNYARAGLLHPDSAIDEWIRKTEKLPPKPRTNVETD